MYAQEDEDEDEKKAQEGEAETPSLLYLNQVDRHADAKLNSAAVAAAVDEDAKDAAEGEAATTG